jgi:hypothetical protein
VTIYLSQWGAANEKCYDPIVTVELESLTQAQLKEQLEKHVRLFDVAYRALLRLSASDRADAAVMQQDAAETVALINRFPNDPIFRSGS